MKGRLTTPSELDAGQLRAWEEIRSASPTLDSGFFTASFARAVASARDDVEVAVLESGGETVGFFPFQRGRWQVGSPLGGALSDFHGAVVRSEGVEWDARELVVACGPADPGGAAHLIPSRCHCPLRP